ncbi:MAG: hypothetical protein HJJLKODD_01515 [Phycisphaerae bacterium]|nr:hypothetical protein [Phycisphaerae bacterium]
MMATQSDIDALLHEAESLAGSASAPSPTVSVPTLHHTSNRSSANGLSPQVQRLLKLTVPVIVQLAERHMNMQEVLALNVGSVIEFDKRFDAELELVVTNRVIGLGHAVKVGENFGLRITRIGTIYDKVRALSG